MTLGNFIIPPSARNPLSHAGIDRHDQRREPSVLRALNALGGNVAAAAQI
jgi:hypothetical protein